MAKNKAQVTIDGKPLTLVGSEPEEYIKKVASYIDEKLNEIRRSGVSKSLNSNMLSILTTINIADDFFKEREKTQLIKEKLEMLQSKSDTPSQALIIEFDESRAKFESEKTILEKEKTSLSDEILKLAGEITSLSDENALLTEKINKAEAEKKTIFAGNNKLALENSSLSGQIKTLSNENANQSEKIKKLEKSIIEKEKSLISGFQREKAGYIRENQELQAKISELENALKEEDQKKPAEIPKSDMGADSASAADKPEPGTPVAKPSIGIEEAAGADELSEKIKTLETEKASLEAELSSYRGAKSGASKKYGASAYRNKKR